MEERSVVTGFLRNQGEILLLRRSEQVGTYSGRWAGVAGHVETEPRESIATEISEETGIDPDQYRLVASGDPFVVEDAPQEIRWLVHPFLFDCPTRAVKLDWEHTASEWVPATEILHRETVPKLWRSYDAVRPTVETVETDRSAGSATLSVRALEVLRDEAAILAAGRGSEFESIEAVGTRLLEARPAMVVIRNRINRAMHAALNHGDGSDPAGAVERSAHHEISDAIDADRRAASALAKRLDGKRIGTLSRSGTVLQALKSAEPAAVLVAESRPGAEGVSVAEQLATETDPTLTSDAAFPGKLREWEADLLVVGADSIHPDGAVWNKVGTMPAAVTASHAEIPVVVVASIDKVATTATRDQETRPATELYDGDASIRVSNPVFERTPPEAIETVVTERGAINRDQFAAIVAEHEGNRRWH